jgi:hypothetical protein
MVAEVRRRGDGGQRLGRAALGGLGRRGRAGPATAVEWRAGQALDGDGGSVTVGRRADGDGDSEKVRLDAGGPGGGCRAGRSGAVGER